MKLEKITPCISIKYFLGVHHTGAKFYEMFLFCNSDNSRSFLVKRWGKIGSLASGGYEMTVAPGDGLDPLAPSSSYSRTVNDKENRGYVNNVGIESINRLFPNSRDGSELRREIVNTAVYGVVFRFDINAPIAKAVEEGFLDIFGYNLLAKVKEELYDNKDTWVFEDIDLSEISTVSDEERGEEWGRW